MFIPAGKLIALSWRPTAVRNEVHKIYCRIFALYFFEFIFLFFAFVRAFVEATKL